MAQTTALSEDYDGGDAKKITEISVPVYNPERECFDDCQKVSGITDILGQGDECFYDWGFKKGDYPTNKNKCPIPTQFASTGFSGIVKNIKNAVYNTGGKSEIYFVVLSGTDRTDKHNEYNGCYSARIETNVVDSLTMMQYNGDVRFNPSDLLSGNEQVKNKAVAVMQKAVCQMNKVCDQALKSNLMQGLRYSNISDAPIYNINGKKRKIDGYVCRKGSDFAKKNDAAEAAAEKKKKSGGKKITAFLAPTNNTE